MTDHNTEQRQAWINAGAPYKHQPAPCLRLDERGRPTFKYVTADKTDIRKTFERVRREQKC